MTGIRHVILSDLHLGGAYSLLTHATDAGVARPSEPAPVLRALPFAAIHPW